MSQAHALLAIALLGGCTAPGATRDDAGAPPMANAVDVDLSDSSIEVRLPSGPFSMVLRLTAHHDEWAAVPGASRFIWPLRIEVTGASDTGLLSRQLFRIENGEMRLRSYYALPAFGNGTFESQDNAFCDAPFDREYILTLASPGLGSSAIIRIGLEEENGIPDEVVAVEADLVVREAGIAVYAEPLPQWPIAPFGWEIQDDRQSIAAGELNVSAGALRLSTKHAESGIHLVVMQVYSMAGAKVFRAEVGGDEAYFERDVLLPYNAANSDIVVFYGELSNLTAQMTVSPSAAIDSSVANGYEGTVVTAYATAYRLDPRLLGLSFTPAMRTLTDTDQVMWFAEAATC